MSDESIARLSLPEIVSLLCRLAEEIETRAMQEAASDFLEGGEAHEH
nr:MAG TPA: Chitin synthase 1 [Caudoviricetes sp.]